MLNLLIIILIMMWRLMLWKVLWPSSISTSSCCRFFYQKYCGIGCRKLLLDICVALVLDFFTRITAALVGGGEAGETWKSNLPALSPPRAHPPTHSLGKYSGYLRTGWYIEMMTYILKMYWYWNWLGKYSGHLRSTQFIENLEPRNLCNWFLDSIYVLHALSLWPPQVCLILQDRSDPAGLPLEGFDLRNIRVA